MTSHSISGGTSSYFTAAGGAVGGAVGGFRALEKYHEGQLSHEKALLIRNIAHDLKNVMHIKADVERQPIDDLLVVLKKNLPNIRQSEGRIQSLSANKDHQMEMCTALARSINARFGRHIIDTAASPSHICEAVSEVMHSLFSGLHGEFVGVAGDTKRVLGNLQILRNSMLQSFEKLMETVTDTGSNRAQLEAMPIYAVFQGELAELDRQIAMLSNMINGVISPTTKTIADLTAEDKDFVGYVRSLKGELGSPDLSKKLSYVLANVNNVAILAAQIDRAFKTAGLDVAEFKRAKNSNELLEHLHRTFERAHKNPTAADVNKFVEVLRMVRNNDYIYDDIAAEITKRASKSNGAKTVRHAARASKRKRGGGLSGTGEMTLEKRMQRQQKTRELLFADFERRLEDQYRQIGASVEVLARRFGAQVKMDDDLNKFVSCMNDLKRDGIDREKFYLALTGYQQDATSREERTRFLGHLNAVLSSLKPLIAAASGSERGHFESIKSAIESVVTTIDTFKDTYLKPVAAITYKTGGDGDEEEKKPGLNRGTVTDINNTSSSDSDDDMSTIAPSDNTSADSDDNLSDGTGSDGTNDVTAQEDDFMTPRRTAYNNEVMSPGDITSPTKDADFIDSMEKNTINNGTRVGIVNTKNFEQESEDTPKEGGDAEEGTFVTLSQAIRHLTFFYGAARIRHNLDISSKDIKGYAKGYETLLGDAMGDQIVAIKKRYEQARQLYDIAAQPVSQPATQIPASATLVDEWIKESSKPGAFFPDGTVRDVNGPLTVNGGTAADLKQWRASVKDNALKFLKDQMQVQVDLIKTVEAIDVYLMNFADAIASNPDTLKDLSQMLKSVDIVGKWFTERSGDTIAELLESTPSALISTYELRPQPDDAWDQNQENHYYKWVEKIVKGGSSKEPGGVMLPANPFLGTLPGKQKDEEDSVYDNILDRAKRAAHSVRVLDNIVSTFAKLGAPQTQGKTFMPAGVIFKNLRQYMYHSAIVMGMDGDVNNKSMMPPLTTQSDIVTTHPPPNITAAFPTPAVRNAACNAIKRTRLDIGVATGAMAGNGLNGPGNAGFTGTVAIPAMATLATNVAAIAGTNVHLATATAANPGQPIATINAAAAVLDDPDNINRQAAEQWVRRRFAMAFSSIPDNRNAVTNDLGKPINGYTDTWQQTDQFFIMAIKSMVAKIFTVIGTYGVFNKPLGKYKSLSSTRLILGGSSIPEIKPEAVELYIRLPLLAEFYRGVFEFENDDISTLPNNWVSMDNSVSKKITLVPEFDGVWENFIKTVFVDAKYISEGSYSEQHIKTIINEVNEIYKKYQNASSTVQDVISAFVAEINRRYGIVKQEDVKRYMKDRRRFDVNSDYSQEDRLEYNILGERDQSGRGPAPSDRFDHAFAATTVQKSDNPWDKHYVDMVYKFRNRIDAQLKNLMPKDGKPPKVSFDSTVRSYRKQIEHAKDNSARYTIILKAMQGTDQLSTVNAHKALMFHELVVAPLGTLYSVWTVLNQFVRRIRALDVLEMESRIEKAITGGTAFGANLYKFFFDALRGTNNKVYGYERYLHRGYKTSIIQNNQTFATMTPGDGSNTDILVYRGTYGAREDITWDDVKHLADVARNGVAGDPQSADTKRRAMEGLKRFLINREDLFRDLINLTYALGGDLGGITDVKVQGHNMIVEYGQLMEYCTTLLNSVKKNIELFRGTIDDAVIRRIEGGDRKTKKAGPEPGSLYFIEEYLMERVLKDARQGMHSARGTIRNPELLDSYGMVMTNEIVGRTFKRLCGTWTVIAKLSGDRAGVNPSTLTFEGPTMENHAGITVPERDLKGLPLALYKHEQSLLRDSFERPMAELLYWRANSHLSVNGGLKINHPLKQPRVVNRGVDEFPFTVIPSIERTNNEDNDIKSIKDIQTVMHAIQDEISVITGAVANSALNNKKLEINAWECSMWKYPTGQTASTWGDVLGNYGIQADVGVDSAGLPTNARLLVIKNRTVAQIIGDAGAIGNALQNIANGGGAGAAAAAAIINNAGGLPAYKTTVVAQITAFQKGIPRVLELGKKYNALSAQRQAIFQTAIRTPVDHRAKWYTDPANAQEGAWFLNQLTSTEADANVDKDDRAVNADQFKSGLLMRLNEALSKYLYTGWDSTKQAMYSGLINKFASGTHITATAKGEALNDIDLPFTAWQTQLNPGILGTPAAQVTIFASLARAMRNIMTLSRRSGDPQFRVDTMMELPIHMKETLKAALPNYIKLFASIIKKAELLRHVAAQVSLVRQNPYVHKYGVNCKKDTNVAGNALPAIPDPSWNGNNLTNIYGTHDVNATAGFLGNVISPIRHLGSTIDSSQYHVNRALLEPNDLIHMDTGFVVRGVTDATAINDVITVATYHHGRAWARGLPASTVGVFVPPYAKGTRYNDVYTKRSCDSRSDRPANLYVGYAPYCDLGEEASRRWHIELIDSVASAAHSINKCASDTYKELVDEPKYLETHEGFISDYTTVNKRAPVMLVSQLQMALRPRFRDDATDTSPNGGEWDFASKAGTARPNFMLPVYRSGETPFKLQYGARLVLGRPDVQLGLEYMPGMANLLDQYNGVSSADSRVEKTEFELFTAAHARLLRYMTDLKFHRAALDSSYSGRIFTEVYPITNVLNPPPAAELTQVPAGSALFDTPLNIAVYNATNWPQSGGYAYPDKARPYTLRLSLEEIIAITESSSQDDTLKNFIASIRGPEGHVDSRATARIYNILDMNIVPINVHALQREIPLINVINYAYTCDRMVQDKLMPDSELPDPSSPYQGELIRVDTTVDPFVVQSTAGMLTKLLLNPYAKVSNEEYYGYVHRIMTGDSGLELGRPKFISDQLWNKVLFQELYTQQGRPARKNKALRDRPDESGPREDAARRRALQLLHSRYDLLARLVIELCKEPVVAGPQANSLRDALQAATPAAAATTFRTRINVIAVAPNNWLPAGAFINAGVDSDPRVLQAVREAKEIANIDTQNGAEQNDAYYAASSPFRDLHTRISAALLNMGPPINPTAADNIKQLMLTALIVVAITMIESELNQGNEPDHFENNGTLQYPDLDDDDNTIISAVDLNGATFPAVGGLPPPAKASEIRHDLANLGRLRFDTTFIRNLVFLVNMQRVMRLIMRDEIQFLESPVVNSSAVINRQITEYNSNEQFDVNVFES